MAINTVKHIDLQHPIQGHDVRVKTIANGDQDAGPGVGGDLAPLGNFTDIMVKIVSQTETYLPLFSRTPVYMDGEIIIVWSATAGVLSFDFVKQTFGTNFVTGMDKGRKNRIRRSNRFALEFAIDTQETGKDLSVFQQDYKGADKAANRMLLKECRCDTLSFGVAAGKGYAVNSWQGTAEGFSTSRVENHTANE